MNHIAHPGLSYRDPLDFLPRRPAQEFSKGRLIYGTERPSSHLYAVMLGRVKVSTTADDGCHTVGRIVREEALFGESCLVGPMDRRESAAALDHVTLMAWSREEIELLVEQEPELGIALSQYMVRECLELQDRIESMAIQKTPERVMQALLQLAADLGTPTPEGATRIASLTHNTIAEFVGTSREIVTSQMNRLRRLGLCRYSRKFIDVHGPAMREHLKRQNASLPYALEEAAGRAAIDAATSRDLVSLV